MAKPTLLYRRSIDGEYLYFRVPDNDTEKDAVLTFNRVMADFGFPPKEIFDKSLGVAVVPSITRIREAGRLITIDILNELERHFLLAPILNADWYKKRF